MNTSRRNWLRGRFSDAPSVVRLPWLKYPEDFTDSCTRCGNCISACPEQIIQPGDGGFPEIKFDYGECTFCEDCASACPENLFSQQRDEAPWLYKAEISTNCLAMNQISCQSCQDACDSRAILFTPKLHSVSQPQIIEVDCNACGACVSVCPATAIIIKLPTIDASNKESSHV